MVGYSGADDESSRPPVTKRPGSDILDAEKYNMVLDKSNIVMLGPTGSGEFKIYVHIMQFCRNVTKLFCQYMMIRLCIDLV